MEAELEFWAGDLARLRFAVSPLWEVATSFRLLRAGRPHPAHRPWVEQVRPRVAAGLERLAELVPPDGYVPDFLNPAPPGPDPALAEDWPPYGRLRWTGYAGTCPAWSASTAAHSAPDCAPCTTNRKPNSRG
ncbi:hypothetical protein ACWD1Z_16775 [Streptomyces sp. NPDC002784]